MSLYVFDLDGVIYRGKTLLPGAKETLLTLEQRGEEICFLSNNSTLSRKGYLKKLTHMGIKVKEEQFFPSSYLTALYLSQNKCKKAFVIGEEGLFEELEKAKVNVSPTIDGVDYVVVGMDRSFNFQKLSLAHQSIVRGAKFLATNTDTTFISEKGISPGAGAIIKALEACTGKTPLVLGKPQTLGLEKVMQEKGYYPEQVILIGDRLETDIAAGRKAGATTVLVLSGISTLKEAKNATFPLKPHYIISTLKELLLLNLPV